MQNQASALTLFYDGLCPLCAAEMRHLKKRDKGNNIRLVDINSAEFAERFHYLDYQALNDKLHAIRDDGSMIQGLDVTYEAWRMVGMGWLYAPLRWPVIRIVADWCYLKFAKHRYTISYLLTGKKRCQQCQ